MKTFGQLQINDIIYRCNYQNANIEKYEVLKIENSIYTNQLKLSLKQYDKEYHYVNHIDIEINVFKDSSYELNRQLIGYDLNTVWCTDKDAVYKTYDIYSKNVVRKLKDTKKIINKL